MMHFFSDVASLVGQKWLGAVMATVILKFEVL